jgi:radical SAM protein with 4Fe4S-binding SPASM domain
MRNLSYRNAKFPIWYHMGLEIHSVCNRDCDWCPRQHDRSGIRKNRIGTPINKKMQSELIYDVLHQVLALGFSGPIHFHSLSEPLLDDRYFDIAMYAKQLGFTIQENTNGDVLLKNHNLLKALDGIVESFNIGIYDCETEKEEKECMAFWNNKFTKTKITFSRMALGNPRIRQNSKFYNNKFKDPDILERPCFSPRYQLLIRYDGEVGLCCEDDICQLSLGNVNTESVESIWWSKRHIDIAFDLRTPGNRKNYPLCKNCYVFFGWS